MTVRAETIRFIDAVLALDTPWDKHSLYTPEDVLVLESLMDATSIWLEKTTDASSLRMQNVARVWAACQYDFIYKGQANDNRIYEVLNANYPLLYRLFPFVKDLRLSSDQQMGYWQRDVFLEGSPQARTFLFSSKEKQLHILETEILTISPRSHVVLSNLLDDPTVEASAKAGIAKRALRAGRTDRSIVMMHTLNTYDKWMAAGSSARAKISQGKPNIKLRNWARDYMWELDPSWAIPIVLEGLALDYTVDHHGPCSTQ